MNATDIVGILFSLIIVALFAFLGGLLVQEKIDQKLAVAHGAAQFVLTNSPSGYISFKWNDEIVKPEKK